MKEIRIDKITLNIGVGQPGDKLDKSSGLLERITGSKAVKTITMKRIPSWGVRPKLAIGCKVTVHGKRAVELLMRLLEAVDKNLLIKNFDKTGNLAFGIAEYIDIPGVEYDADLGIIGLDVAITLKRPGFRVKGRRLYARKIPVRHRITKEEAMGFMKNTFKVNILKEVEEITI